MVTVVCVKWGTLFGSEYVNKLFYGIKRNSTVPFKMVCFTEDARGIDPEIEIKPFITNALTGWWYKLSMFSKDSGLSGQILFMDLDTIIVGNMDHYLTYTCPNNFTILKDVLYIKRWLPDSNKYGSAILGFVAEEWYHIWEEFSKDVPEFVKKYNAGGDQRFLAEVILTDKNKVKLWQDIFPEEIVSYKGERIRITGLLGKEKIVCFHGQPRPHEVADSPFMIQHWSNIKPKPLINNIVNTGDRKMKLLSKCICGSEEGYTKIINGVSIIKCNCGIIRQDLNMTEQDYYNFYKTQYHTEFQDKKGVIRYAERYDHDKEVAKKRLSEYKSFIKLDGRHLDLGSSNNAFVDCLRENNIECYGIELGEAGKNHLTTWTDDLLNIGFPIDYFSTVYLHDVLEHFIDPNKYLKEIRRILKQGGSLIIDLPDYFDVAGRHHWKNIEHLWYWNSDQLVSLLESTGFEVKDIKKPIPGKIVFYVTNTAKPIGPKVLLMPGTGDAYWGLVKLESIISKTGANTPQVYVWDHTVRTHIHGKHRSNDFLERVPFIKYVSPIAVSYNFERESKSQKTIGKNQYGFDYVLNMNGILEAGMTLEDWDIANYSTNWEFPLFQTLEEKKYQEEYKEKYGNYNVVYFNDLAFYGKLFCPEMPPQTIYDLLLEIYNKTGRKTVLMGAQWDKPYQDKILALDVNKILYDEVMKTTQPMMFSLLRAAKFVLGWASGATIIATHFKVPTYMFWSSKQWPNAKKFMWNAINPNTHNKTYWAYDLADGYNKNAILEKATSV